MHETQHRGLRELYAATRHLVSHWSRLAPRLSGSPAAVELELGVASARELLTELGSLTPAYGLYGRPAAQGVGARLAGARNAVGDRFLERNQALRMAVLDVQHASTLLGYLARASAAAGDDALAAFAARWEERMLESERSVRAAAIAQGDDPDWAVAPVDPTSVGRAAHRLANGVGTAGEWFDARLGAGRSRDAR